MLQLANSGSKFDHVLKDFNLYVIYVYSSLSDNQTHILLST